MWGVFGPDHQTMPRTSARTVLMLTLVLVALPFGVAMASENGSSSGNQGSTKTEPPKTVPSTTPTTTGPADTHTATTPAPATGDTASDAGADNADNDSHKGEPEPELGHSVVVDPGQGTVNVQTPGSQAWHAADELSTLPVGSIVDVTHGHVTIQTAVDAAGHSQSGTFWGGRFEIRQAPHGVTELVVTGPRPTCGKGGAVASANRTTGLWGHDHHGKFRTRGRNAVATVRGTTWYVGERCGGTYTRVTSGSVRVWDRNTHHSVVLHAGQSHLSRSRG